MAPEPEVTAEPPAAVDRLPTLTEVVLLGEPTSAGPSASDAASVPGPTAADASPPAAMPAVPGPAVPAAIDTDALVGEVLAELAPRIDMLLQSRLREVLAPALARAADGLIRDAREGLATTLHELVDEAVARALKRRAGR